MFLPIAVDTLPIYAAYIFLGYSLELSCIAKIGFL